MSGSVATPLVNVAKSASGEVDSLLIEKLTGKVHEQNLKGENILTTYFAMQEVVGTNMVSNKYIGETELQSMIAGQEAKGSEIEYDKNALVVDAPVIARNIVDHLSDVQSDLAGNKSKIAVNHSKQLKRLEDQMAIQQLVFGAISNTKAIRKTPRVKGHGFSVKVDITDDQAEEPNCMLGAIEEAIAQQVAQEMDTDDLVILLNHDAFDCLSDAERLVNKEYTTESGVNVNGYVLKGRNIPVVPSNRFPSIVNTAKKHHLLSKASNNYRYDVTAEMTTCFGVIFSPDALLVGRTIALQGDIFWDKIRKCWFIDTWLAEGAIPDRWEAVSGLFKGAAASNTAVQKRADRKASRTKSI